VFVAAVALNFHRPGFLQYSRLSFQTFSRLPSAQSYSITEQKHAASDRLKRQAAFSAFVVDVKFGSVQWHGKCEH
jgi:hypothetical protein